MSKYLKVEETVQIIRTELTLMLHRELFWSDPLQEEDALIYIHLNQELYLLERLRDYKVFQIGMNFVALLRTNIVRLEMPYLS